MEADNTAATAADDEDDDNQAWKQGSLILLPGGCLCPPHGSERERRNWSPYPGTFSSDPPDSQALMIVEGLVIRMYLLPLVLLFTPVARGQCRSFDFVHQRSSLSFSVGISDIRDRILSTFQGRDRYVIRQGKNPFQSPRISRPRHWRSYQWGKIQHTTVSLWYKWYFFLWKVGEEGFLDIDASPEPLVAHARNMEATEGAAKIGEVSAILLRVVEPWKRERRGF